MAIETRIADEGGLVVNLEVTDGGGGVMSAQADVAMYWDSAVLRVVRVIEPSRATISRQYGVIRWRNRSIPAKTSGWKAFRVEFACKTGSRGTDIFGSAFDRATRVGDRSFLVDVQCPTHHAKKRKKARRSKKKARRR